MQLVLYMSQQPRTSSHVLLPLWLWPVLTAAELELDGAKQDRRRQCQREICFVSTFCLSVCVFVCLERFGEWVAIGTICTMYTGIILASAATN